VAVAVAAAAGVTGLFMADMGRAILLSSSTVALVPPALYLVLAFALLRGAPVGRKLGWAVAACGINAMLALLSGVTLSFTYPMSFEGAMRRALWAFAPGPLIHLVAAPLVLLAWRSRVVPLRITARAESGYGGAMSRVPALPLAASTPDWDSVLRAPAPSTWAPGPATAVFDRPTREPEVEPEPAPRVRREPTPMAAVAVAVAPPEVVALPLVALPSPPPPVETAPARTRAVPPPAPMPVVEAPKPKPVVELPRPKPVVAAPAPIPAVTAPEPSPVEATAAPTIDEPVIRVPFERIAAQLPPDVFVLPPERLAESVREPHVIVIPCRLVLPQLGEGAVEIPWTLVDDQFPELALAMPKIEVRRRFPGWVLSLPMDEVVRQIPADVFHVHSPAPDLFDLGQFPAPFKPEPPAPEEAAAKEEPAPLVVAHTEPVAEPEPVVEAVPEPLSAPVTAAAIEVELEPEPVTPEPVVLETVAPAPVVAEEIPAVVIPFVEPVAVSVPAPMVVSSQPAPVAPPVLDITPIPAPAVVAGIPAPSVTDEESEALGRTLALGLMPLGAFDWQARRIGGRPLVSFVPPALAREPIDAMAAGAAPLVERLASWGIEQVTIRTTRLVCVLTPLGTRGCFAATVRRGGAVAMLEMLSTRAGRATGDTTSVTSPAIAFPAVATSPASNGNGHRGVGEATRALAAFGPLAMSVAEAEGAAPSVYVFGGQDQAVLAGAARAVHETLVVRHDEEALGRLESVVLRRGRERAVLRPLRGHGGAPAVLAAAGEVALAGRAHRAVAQAAALLEAR
jgi:hypothetical protein